MKTNILIIFFLAISLIAAFSSCRTVHYGWYIQQAKVEHVRQTPDSTYTDFFLRPVGVARPLPVDSIREDKVITTMIRKRIPR